MSTAQLNIIQTVSEVKKTKNGLSKATSVFVNNSSGIINSMHDMIRHSAIE